MTLEQLLISQIQADAVEIHQLSVDRANMQQRAEGAIRESQSHRSDLMASEKRADEAVTLCDRLTAELGHHAAKEGQYRDALRAIAQHAKKCTRTSCFTDDANELVAIKDIVKGAGFLQEYPAPVVTTEADEIQAVEEMMAAQEQPQAAVTDRCV